MQWIKLDQNSITNDLFQQLVHLENTCGLEPYSPEMLWDCISELDTYAWIDGNTVAGFITIQPSSGYLNGGIYIVNLNINFSYRQQGLGRSLMLTGLALYGFSHQGKTVTLDVSKNNIAALNLYKKLGFRVTDFPSGNGPGDYVMIADLDIILGTCITQRLTLRPMTPENVKTLAHILTDRSVNATYMVPDMDGISAQQLASRIITLSYDNHRYVRGIFRNDLLIGFINDVEILNKTIELGWVITPAEWGKGFATEAVRAAIADLFAKEYQRVTAGAFAQNKASLRVMEKAGMQLLEKIEEIEYRGEKHHCIYYERSNT